MSNYVTATDIYKYLKCPHWPYYDRHATPEDQAQKREPTESEISRREDGMAHEADVVQKLFADGLVTLPVTKDPIKACAETIKQMKEGARAIYQGTLTHETRTGRPDLLERREGKSDLGDWYYIPLDVKTTTHLEKYQKFQLTFYAQLLEAVQGRLPDEAGIINSEGVCLKFDPSEMQSEFNGLMKDIERTVAGEKPDLVLRKDCYDSGVWGKLCERSAKESNDIALLYKVDVQKLRALRSLGIRTVEDAAAMDPGAIAGTVKGLTLHSLEVMKRQAESLKNGSVCIRKPVELKTRGLEIHFDIESDPPNDVDYLYGFLLRSEGRDMYQAFVAESLEDEEGMWRKFLAWLETLPTEYTVYHFSPYEISRLSVMENRYGGSQWLDLFRANMVDLKEYVSSYVTFPLYFYGLKYIAKFLGFKWRNALVKTGGDSVDQFEKYLETQDRALLDAIIMYNEDDVRATAHLKDWLVTNAGEVQTYEQPYPWTEAKNPFVVS